MARRSGVVWLGYFLGWLLLAALAALTAWQAHVMTLALAAWLINQPTLRPPGWNSGTLVALSKFSLVGWGALWLIGTYYVEYQLRESTYARGLWQQWLRFAIIIGVALGLTSLPMLF